MVRASGSSTSSAAADLDGGGAALQLRLQARAKATSRSRQRSWVRHSSASGMCSTRFQMAKSVGLLPLDAQVAVVEVAISGESQLWVWTPLVIGRSASRCRAAGPDGSFHIAARRCRAACSRRWSVRQLQGQHGHAERLLLVAGCWRPRARNSSRSIPIGSPCTRRGTARSWPSGKASLPAGTGVCVVKHVPALTASRAEAKSSLFLDQHPDALQPVNAACPSFMWQTVGNLPSGRSARMPPMPRMISCWMRVCWSPP
jgi:hypothetical protein